MNVWSFTGNLGRDCEVKYLPNGTALCEFAVAVTSGYGDKEKTTWVRCRLFGKRAEGALPQHLVKGQKVAISGEMTLETWEKDGQKNSAVSVMVNSLDLIGAKSEQQGGYQQAPQQPAQNQMQQQPAYNQQQPNPRQAPSNSMPDFEEDIPFN